MVKCKLLAFLLCDNATRDRDGKVSLHGLFDKLIAPRTRRWIAACAVRYGIPLVTHNRRHFEGIPGLEMICEAPQL
jgi:hypothetical protein